MLPHERPRLPSSKNVSLPGLEQERKQGEIHDHYGMNCDRKTGKGTSRNWKEWKRENEIKDTGTKQNLPPSCTQHASFHSPATKTSDRQVTTFKLNKPTHTHTYNIPFFHLGHEACLTQACPGTPLEGNHSAHRKIGWHTAKKKNKSAVTHAWNLLQK